MSREGRYRELHQTPHADTDPHTFRLPISVSARVLGAGDREWEGDGWGFKVGEWWVDGIHGREQELGLGPSPCAGSSAVPQAASGCSKLLGSVPLLRGKPIGVAA